MLGVISHGNLSMDRSRALSWFYKVLFTRYCTLLFIPTVKSFPVSCVQAIHSTVYHSLRSYPLPSALSPLPSSPIMLHLNGILVRSTLSSGVLQLSHTGDGPRSIDLVPYFHSLIHTPLKGGARTPGLTSNPTHRPALDLKFLESTPFALTVVDGHRLELMAEMYQVSSSC